MICAAVADERGTTTKNPEAHAAFIAGCAGYPECFLLFEVHVKEHLDFEFQDSTLTENQKAGIEFEFVCLTIA